MTKPKGRTPIMIDGLPKLRGIQPAEPTDIPRSCGPAVHRARLICT